MILNGGLMARCFFLLLFNPFPHLSLAAFRAIPSKIIEFPIVSAEQLL